jgi:FKBP-type peptidyl-prolyl cis-trans isomerase FklB
MIKNKFVIALLLLPLLAKAEDVKTPQGFKTKEEATSYALGIQTGRTLTKDGLPINFEQFIRGLKDQIDHKEAAIPESDLRQILTDFQNDLRREMKNKHALLSVENGKKGEAFLKENKAKPGVVTLPSGLQYSVIKTSNGDLPADGDTVSVKYKGMLVDGKVFDSTKEGESIPMNIDQVIPGFKEGLKLMTVGSQYKFFIPSGLAYGPRSVGSDIGPNETLIFEVELFGITKGKPVQ